MIRRGEAACYNSMSEAWDSVYGHPGLRVDIWHQEYAEDLTSRPHQDQISEAN